MTGSDDVALIDRQAAIDHAAADLRAHGRLIDFRIPAPLFLAGARIDGEDDAPVGDAVERAVRHQRRAFLVAAARTDFVGPGQPQPADVGRVDLIERAVAGFARSQAVAQPFFSGLAGVPQRGIVDGVELPLLDVGDLPSWWKR